jgi:hypothetical protein
MGTSEQPIDGIKELARSDVGGLRAALRNLGVVVAEADLLLRYVWIDNPHSDFDPQAVVGKRDDELIAASEAAEIMELKAEVLLEKKALSRVLAFDRSDGAWYYSLCAFPIIDDDGKIDGIFTIGFPSSRARWREP